MPQDATYATPIDRQSAHEIITARLRAAQAAVVAMQPNAAGAGFAAPGGPTPAQERAEIERRASELERIRRDAEREARTQAGRMPPSSAARSVPGSRREREISQVGTTVLRRVLGTPFGGSSRRRR